MKTQNQKIKNGKPPGNISRIPERKKTILIADDDPGIQDIYSIIFQKAGFIVDIKNDGADLMGNTFNIPDIFLIDKQLSGYSGLDVCRHLKNHPKTKDIPLVIISAAPNIGSLSLEAGADAFLEKPFELKELLEMIQSFTNESAKAKASN